MDDTESGTTSPVFDACLEKFHFTDIIKSVPSYFGKTHHRLCALLLGLGLVLYGQVLGFDVLSWDDLQNVSNNPFLIPPSWKGLQYLWTHDYFDMFIPVSFTVWAAGVQLSTLIFGSPSDPSVFHALNLMLHLANTALVFTLLRRWTRTEWAALAGAALFAFHPIQAESVACISNLRDLLAGFFSLLTLLLFQNGSKARGLLSTLTFLLAIFSKPSAIVVPFLALLTQNWGAAGRPLDVFRNGPKRLWHSVNGWIGLWLLVGAGISIATKILQPDVGLTFETPLWARPLIAADALSFYLFKIFVPLTFVLDYGRSPAFLLQDFLLQGHWGPLFWTWIPIAALGALLVWKRKTSPWLLSGGLFFVIALLPVLGLVPFQFQNISTVSDRYIYLAMLGPAYLFACFVTFLESRFLRSDFLASGFLRSGSLASHLKRNPHATTTAIVMIVLVPLAVKAAHQTQYWESTEKLFNHNLKLNPRSATSYTNLGNVAASKGDYQKALTYQRQALELHPKHRSASHNVGVALFQLGKIDEALAHYEKLVEEKPNALDYRVNLAFCLIEKRRIEDAATQYREIIRLFPEHEIGFWNLALLYMRHPRPGLGPAEAIPFLNETLARNPENAEAREALARMKQR